MREENDYIIDLMTYVRNTCLIALANPELNVHTLHILIIYQLTCCRLMYNVIKLYNTIHVHVHAHTNTHMKTNYVHHTDADLGTM